MMPIFVAFLVGTVLAGLIPIVPFALVGIVIFAAALVGLSFVDALVVFACLQAGYVSGLVIRALARRFQTVTSAASVPGEHNQPVDRARYFIRQAFSASHHK